jgi:hypothetical protein
MLASPGPEYTEGNEVERLGLILNSVSGSLYYDETWQPEVDLSNV